MYLVLQIGMSVKNENKMANGVDTDETAHHEPSHQDLHCLPMYLIWCAGLKGFKEVLPFYIIYALPGSIVQLVVCLTTDQRVDWLQSPVTKYFFLIILSSNPVK